MPALRPAPPLIVADWLNATAPITLDRLQGRVVMLVAFQMLCPGCVSHGLPQAARAREAFGPADLAVIGLHTVFEHHEAQGSRAALSAFLHEYRISLPVGVDAASPSGGPPQTMRAYGMQGTPTTILIDRRGLLRLHRFGHVDDMRLGAAIEALIGDRSEAAVSAPTEAAKGGNCDSGVCEV